MLKRVPTNDDVRRSNALRATIVERISSLMLPFRRIMPLDAEIRVAIDDSVTLVLKADGIHL
jgi:hypothetical protein